MSTFPPLEDLYRQHRDDPLSSYGSLRNPVHRIFNRKHFHADFEYSEFLPSLRLASKLLLSPQALLYFHTLFFGEEYDTGWQDSSGYSLKEVWSTRRVCTLSRDDIYDVHEKLMSLAKMVTFEVADTPNGVAAQCEALSVHRTDPIFLDLPGADSKIRISTQLYNEVIGLKDFEEGSEMHALEVRFDAAVTLLHEIGHSAEYAQKKPPERRFFEESPVLEAGYQIEAHISGFSGYDANGTRIHEWPNPVIVDTCSENGRGLLVRDDRALRRCDFTWPMPKYFPMSLLQGWFWEEMERTIDARALVPAPIARSIRTALKHGARIFVPQAIVDLFEHATELPKSLSARYFDDLVRDKINRLLAELEERSRMDSEKRNAARF